MLVGIMTTDHGPHPHDEWAFQSASMLLDAFQVDPNSPNRMKLERAKLRATEKVAAILEAHFESCISKERELLKSGAHERLSQELDATEHTEVEAAIADVRGILQDVIDVASEAKLVQGEFGVNIDHLVLDEHLMAIIEERLLRDFHTAIEIERSWHADRNPGNEHAEAFKARRA